MVLVFVVLGCFFFGWLLLWNRILLDLFITRSESQKLEGLPASELDVAVVALKAWRQPPQHREVQVWVLGVQWGDAHRVVLVAAADNLPLGKQHHQVEGAEGWVLDVVHSEVHQVQVVEQLEVGVVVHQRLKIEIVQEQLRQALRLLRVGVEAKGHGFKPSHLEHLGASYCLQEGKVDFEPGLEVDAPVVFVLQLSVVTRPRIVEQLGAQKVVSL